MSGTIRVIVVDDHAVVREGIRTVLEQAEGVTVVGEAATGEEALEAVSALRPDVVVLDITMPGLSGLEVAERVRDREPATRVLILSMHDHPEYVLGALRAGAAGYLLKNAGPAEVRQAVRAVAEGRQHLPASVASRLGVALRQEAERERNRARSAELTPREREILVRVASGATSRVIADELGISHRTVETHRDSIMRKLDIRSVAGLTRFALESGLLED